MTPFYVCGGLFAGWALLVSFLGITRESFPPSDGAGRTVGLISTVLFIAAVGTAIYCSATVEHEPAEGEEHALLQGR